MARTATARFRPHRVIDAGEDTVVRVAPPDFEALYAEHHDFVRRCALGMGAPRHLADDVTQDVFLVALRRLPDFDGRRSMRGWLFGIVRNIARRALHDARRVSPPLYPQPAPDPAEAVERKQAAGFVHRFLAGIDEDKRAVFVLSDVEGMSAPEVARVLGVKLNTVYSRLRVVRTKFAEAVAREEARRRSAERAVERTRGGAR